MLNGAGSSLPKLILWQMPLSQKVKVSVFFACVFIIQPTNDKTPGVVFFQKTVVKSSSVKVSVSVHEKKKMFSVLAQIKLQL